MKMGDEKAKWCYDVFLAFRGQDTRYNFTGNLYDALRRARISTFMDDSALKGGDQISASLLRALEASRISIVVLSENYAFSTWCLEELVNIVRCRRTYAQVVLPIFYDVDPSDVRKQTGRFDEAMVRHIRRFGDKSEKIKEWRSALTEIANLRGWDFRYGDRYEYKLIQDIVRWVTNSFLYNALSRSGFQTFMNDGDHISQSNIEVEAIENSRLSIIVFSENYARSSSCLDELLTILECMKLKNQLVWPVFYKVEPSDLRHQRNSWGEAMIEHENMLGNDSQKVQKWRLALLEVANLKGWHHKTGYEYELIEKIVEMATKI